jgi:hypothetical protein
MASAYLWPNAAGEPGVKVRNFSRLKSRSRSWVALFAAAAILAGCGSGKSVGSDKILEFPEQEGGRLGANSPSPEPANPDNPGPPPVQPSAPAAQAPPPEAPPETFFDVALTPNHPYYQRWTRSSSDAARRFG